MENPMKVLSSESYNWVIRTWRKLIAWDEAINANPIDLLERRVTALEKEIWTAIDRSGIRPAAKTGGAG
jgi:hypothetical protein